MWGKLSVVFQTAVISTSHIFIFLKYSQLPGFSSRLVHTNLEVKISQGRISYRYKMQVLN